MAEFEETVENEMLIVLDETIAGYEASAHQATESMGKSVRQMALLTLQERLRKANMKPFGAMAEMSDLDLSDALQKENGIARGEYATHASNLATAEQMLTILREFREGIHPTEVKFI